MFDLIINQAKILGELGNLWTIMLLVFARCIGFVVTAPLLGSKTIPGLAKVSFGIFLTLFIAPMIELPSEYPKDFLFVYLIVINAAIGMLMGWLISLVIDIAKVAGEMLDNQMALHAATLFDPGTQQQTTLIGHFFDLLALALFVSIGGMEKTIEGLARSFVTMPPVIYELTFNFGRILKATQDIITIGFLIVSPIVMILLLLDLILGLMSRAAPQINAFQVSFSIKPSAGIILIIILLPTLFEIFTKLFSEPMRYFY